MADVNCTGCVIYFDNRRTSYSAGDSYVTGYDISGVSYGQLTGITGSTLCYVDIVSYTSRDGKCEGATGLLSYTGNPYATGSWTLNSGATFCTGSVGCTSYLKFYVTPNPVIFSQVSGAVLMFSAYNYANGNASFMSVTTSSPVVTGSYSTGVFVTGMDPTVLSCGQRGGILLEARWIAPANFSGYVLGNRLHSIYCTPCSNYEMVAL